MRRLLGVAAGVLALAAPAAARAVTIAVDTTADAMASDGHCSLREAITAANSDNFPEPGPNECPKGDGADTITLGPGSFEFTRAGADDDFNASGDLDITSATTITGAGALLTTIDAKQLDRVLDVLNGGSLTLSGVTVTGGHAPDGTTGASHAGTGDNGAVGESGGGIRGAGPLVLTDTVVTANQAGAGGNGGTGTGADAAAGATGGSGQGGSAGNGGDGGGIWTTDDLTLTRVVISSDHAGNGGNGGLGQGGMGGFTTSGTAGQGGGAHGGNGGFGGNGGGVSVGGTGVANIDSSSVHSNTAGDAGTGGTGHGGLGGAAGLNPSNGGQGGPGTGGAGEQGGSGAGISVSRTLTLTRSLVRGNTSGHGGPGGSATGGNGGGSTNGNGGRGGDATVGSSVGGGATGGVDSPAGTISDTTITGNHSGSATIGGAATGGKGGGGTAAGGAGGNADAGFGGNGGYVGGIGANDTMIVHVTITGNTLGAGGAAATATAGAGGSPGGSAGSASPGLTGSVMLGSAIYPNGTTTLRNSIVAGNDPHACVAGLTDGGHNVSFGDASCPGANVDPSLGPLVDNGGPTLTFRPQSGSPVIDAVPVPGAGCTPTDQRGAARPGGASCDIGAYETAPPALVLGELGPTVRGTVNPNARATTYHFEYGTTSAYGTSTAEGSLPARVDPVAVSAALDGLAPGTTYHVRVVATNADGTNASGDGTFTTSSQGGGGSTKDTTAPVILSASVKPKTFRRKRGTTFRYKLSEGAKVVFTIQRKKGKRYVKATRFSKASRAGENTRKFRPRKLKPGRYRATLVATDAAGNRSKAKRLTFRIKR